MTGVAGACDARQARNERRPETPHATLDGNEACAAVAYRCSEVVSIYPITPASPMGELADAWANARRPNMFGTVPTVIEMQSEAGAVGAVHGALQTGALTTTFTASQGLLLMLPDMFKIAGELTPAVFHIAARSVATHALSIFGDHSDVMAARTTGWAMLASASVQEAQDLAMIAHAATLQTRVPFLHFFDGFRTSHEVNRIETLPTDVFETLIDRRLVIEHRRRALDPDRPVIRGTAQNPDVFFQAREAANVFYQRTPAVVRETMEAFAECTGRRYGLFDYTGHPEAEHVVVVMGSGAGALEEAVRRLVERGERVGVVKVRLYRPFDVGSFIETLPRTVRSISVLDRTKEPGAVGEPLYTDVVSALHEAWPGEAMPRVRGGRYGLSSKEFTPAMAMAVLDERGGSWTGAQRHFTIGITDDVTRLSLDWDRDRTIEPDDTLRAVVYGLGSDGTVGANRNAVRIATEADDLHAQGYFVYDSKKSGAVTVSHLRFGPRPIDAPYLIGRAGFVACHQFSLFEQLDVLRTAEDGATVLVNAPYGPEGTWSRLPREAQAQVIERRLRLFVVDAHGVASKVGLPDRVGMVMQPCFFALTKILPGDVALEKLRASVRRLYGKRGESVVRRNLDALDLALAEMHEIEVPAEATATHRRRPPVPDHAPDFVKRVTGAIIAGHGDLLPVSAMPVDGTFPVGTAQYEKRGIAREIPIWDPGICVDCGLCALVCPHAAIRTKIVEPAALEGGPEGFRSRPWAGDGDRRYVVQVAPDDCTGCGGCVDICPARSKESVKHKSINMEPVDEHLERERGFYDFFLDGLPEADRGDIRLDTVKGSQLLEPLFEYSGACAGCGETPYLKLMSQLFGDRTLVANATGCSSIYGGNLPTTPWSCNAEGRGPAWSNSLFEDNGEFGLGMRLALDQRRATATRLLGTLRDELPDPALADAIVDADRSGQSDEASIAAQRARVADLLEHLGRVDRPEASELASVIESLVRKNVWIVGGDGWAYDIGFGGLDHVLATGRDVNVLVLDTEVYSNTGGQASKSTPRAAVAKFAAGGKPARKKDLGLLAMTYGSVYVAQVAIGANPQQTLRAFLEAESWPGPSLIIAYSPCIAHGIDMSGTAKHEKEAVDCGYWPLYRYDPRRAHEDDHPLQLDSRRPKRPFRDFAAKEARFAMLKRAAPDDADRLMQLAQRDIDERWHLYEQMAGIERTVPEQEVEA